MSVANKQKKQPAVPKELNDVAQDTVDRLEERLDKCYSQEDYKKFQDDVSAITLVTMGSEDGRKKIKEYGRESAKEYIEDEGWKQKTFWIPTIVACISAVASVVAAVIVAIRA